MLRIWTFWPCGCAMFPSSWVMCDDCMVFAEGRVELIPGASWTLDFC